MYAYPQLEEETLRVWETTNLFEATLNPENPLFVFYDGPPFANGLPHYGHLLTGYVKDAVPRYKTMQGYYVPRCFGWDTHGLPAELEAMRTLGYTTTAEVEENGVDTFNEACRNGVLKYSNEWVDTVKRQARWVSFDDTYMTMDPEFMESTVWAFKELYDKGLLYQAFRVMPYCWNDGTPLSNHELNMDGDTYKDVTDLSATVKLRLVDPMVGETETNLLVWTTTPWTLPANLMVAVHPEATYVVVEHNNEHYLLGENALQNYTEFSESPVVAKLNGNDLVGRKYVPLYSDYSELHEKVHTVTAADWVDPQGSGTALVHLAPGFGEVDKETCDAVGVPTVVPMDTNGHYTNEVPRYNGKHYTEVNELVLQDLSAQVHLVEPYTHSYPHCWRCGNPLVYKGVDSWFLSTTSLKERLLSAATEVNWVNKASETQFRVWLENTRDWGLSRNRYWGTPVPVWMSDNPEYPRTDVYGSYAELERDFGALPTNPTGEVDLHRPYVDELTRPNPDDPTGRSTMRRVPEVLDVWFDSGAMPFAQAHYPFKNKELFEENFPADFVVEYVAQTRGWFYTMHVLSVALFDRPAFKTCLAHGVVLGDDGEKMSKSKRNYPDVNDVFDTYGADAMRWLLLGSPVLSGGNLTVSEDELRRVTQAVLNPMENVVQWYKTHAETHTPVFKVENDLDRYLLHKLQLYVGETTKHMDSYGLNKACRVTEGFLETVTNWWVRNSRSRMTTEGDAALGVLNHVLTEFAKAVAPLLPFAAERVYSAMGHVGSVHSQRYPTVDGSWFNYELATAMEQVQELVSAGSRARKELGVRLRHPLNSVTVYGAPVGLREQVSLVAELLNVKNVVWADDVTEQRLVVNPRTLGPRLGKEMKRVLAAAKRGEWQPEGETVVVDGVELLPNEFELVSHTPDHLTPWVHGSLEFDSVVTDELALEAVAVDFLRAVQQARKDRGFSVADKKELTVSGNPELLEFLKECELLNSCNVTVVSWAVGSEQGFEFLG